MAIRTIRKNGHTYRINPDRSIDKLVDGEYEQTDKSVCERCGEHTAMHYGNEDLCCWCHIKEGGIPADWHTIDMALMKEEK